MTSDACVFPQDIRREFITKRHGLEGGAGGGVKESPKDGER